MPNAAALRNMPPRFSWSPSFCTHGDAPRAGEHATPTAGSGHRSPDATAPRCRSKPTTARSTSGAGDVHRRVEAGERAGEHVVLRRRHEHRADRAGPIAASARDHERRLGDEEPPLGLDPPAELRVREPDVVGEPRRRRVVDRDHRHRAHGTTAGPDDDAAPMDRASTRPRPCRRDPATRQPNPDPIFRRGRGRGVGAPVRSRPASRGKEEHGPRARPTSGRRHRSRSRPRCAASGC